MLLAGVGIELQGHLRGGTALGRDLGLHLLGVGATDGRQVGWVLRVAGIV